MRVWKIVDSGGRAGGNSNPNGINSYRKGEIMRNQQQLNENVARPADNVFGKKNLYSFIYALILLFTTQNGHAFEIIEDFVWIYTPADNAPFLRMSQGYGGYLQEWDLTGDSDEYFLKDTSAGTIPFRIAAGAPNDSLKINHAGYVGFGTVLPRTTLHLLGTDFGNTAVRLESNGQGSYANQTWDLTAHLFGFSLTDLGDPDDEEDDLNPLFVESGTPSDTLYLSSLGSGHVGIGTSQPELIGSNYLDATSRHLNVNAETGTARLIAQGKSAAESYMVHSGGTPGARIVRTRLAGGRYVISTMKDDLSKAVEPDAFSIALATGNVGIKTATSKYPLQVGDRGQKDGNGAYVSTGGVWTNACSRAVKDHIEPITLEQARDTVRALQPVGYHYKNEPGEHYCGFIAEDVPDLVATKDRQSLACMDIVSVLTRVVQDQDRQLEEAAKRDERQRQMIDRQQEMLASMHERLLKLEENGATQSSRHAEVIARNSRP